jgi:hypothetical protein
MCAIVKYWQKSVSNSTMYMKIDISLCCFRDKKQEN